MEAGTGARRGVVLTGQDDRVTEVTRRPSDGEEPRGEVIPIKRECVDQLLPRAGLRIRRDDTGRYWLEFRDGRGEPRKIPRDRVVDSRDVGRQSTCSVRWPDEVLVRVAAKMGVNLLSV